MKKKLFATLMLTGIILSASCTRDEVDDPTLQLSENGTITLPKAASEKAVIVTTNQTEWTAISNVEWLELTQSGATLTIKAIENVSLMIRKAEVAVLAGGIARKLTIEQAESELTVVTFPDKLETNQWGGTFLFDVDANSDDWNITSDAEWINVTPKQFKKEVIIEVAENATREDRVAKLIIFSGENANVKEITISQSGIIYYILPYLKGQTTLADIIEFEEARWSLYSPDFGSLFGDHLFLTKSPIFTSILYSLSGSNLVRVEMVASSDKFIADPDFTTLLTDYGFEKKPNNEYSMIVTEGDKKYGIELKVTSGNKIVLAFTIRQLQDGPMPSFDTMPYGFVFFKEPGGSIENVHEWENKNGGKYNEEASAPNDGFYCFDAPAPWLLRSYIFENQPYLIQTFNIFPDIDKFFYEVSGIFYFTEEFNAIMEKEGFTDYLGSSIDGLVFYGSATNPLEMGIKVTSYADVLDGTPVVELRFSKSDSTRGGSIWKPVKTDTMPKKIPHFLVSKEKKIIQTSSSY